MLLTVRELSKVFGSLKAVDQVDFEVAQGEIFGIAGPNGAGKTTLFNLIAGMLPPTSGRITFDGQEITGLKDHQVCHRGIGRTFQVPKTFPSMTVGENIRVGALFGGGPDDRFEPVIRLLDLEEDLGRSARNLDLFTLKRISLAMALVTGCRLLLLDEPMAGLSISEIEQYVALVRRVNSEMAVTVVVIEHLLDTLVDISERVLILHNGCVIYCGDPQQMAQDEKVRRVYVGKGSVHAA